MRRLLDLCCGQGGATKGYQDAGFYVVGVDIDACRDYPGDEHHQCDALEFAAAHAHEYDFIHASPPCQGFSSATADEYRSQYPNLIPGIREILQPLGKPFVIENVVPAAKKAPMRRDLLLCGEMFGLRVVRHRIFEFGGGLEITQPFHRPHRGAAKGSGRRSRGTYTTDGYYFGVYGEAADRGTIQEWRDAMGIDWMTARHDLAEALPPVYTRYITERYLASQGM
jgi:DNA (cytosine-5)-methyltransferase 1